MKKITKQEKIKLIEQILNNPKIKTFEKLGKALAGDLKYRIKHAKDPTRKYEQ